MEKTTHKSCARCPFSADPSQDSSSSTSARGPHSVCRINPLLTQTSVSGVGSELRDALFVRSKKACLYLCYARRRADKDARNPTGRGRRSQLSWAEPAIRGRGEAGIEIRRKNANKNASLSLSLYPTFYGLKFSWLEFFVHLAGARAHSESMLRGSAILGWILHKLNCCCDTATQ